MEKKLPRKKLPEFKIGKEQIDELKTVSAVTKILAENPKLATEIAEIFNQVAEEKERELVEKVTKLLSEKVKEVPPEKIRAAFGHWCPWYLPPPVPARFLYRSPEPFPPPPHCLWFRY
jgi:hypothetical protein